MVRLKQQHIESSKRKMSLKQRKLTLVVALLARNKGFDAVKIFGDCQLDIKALKLEVLELQISLDIADQFFRVLKVFVQNFPL
ncbi:hypothetical protein FRX31_004879 [Thalictrum thalictroides]|uniref:Uncharacterized protein n=1 Tax=Thalictrum thalictroides TaxID=46969 RepID=A0A7J6X6Y6_THATH|nr:hypothetical protein FRX31_004879 [Thalictrum thalictroides]